MKSCRRFSRTFRRRSDQKTDKGGTVKNTTAGYYAAYQLKLQVDIEKVIEISDPIYAFCDVLKHIDLKYLADKESGTCRKRYNSETLLKVILFAFMEFGYVSVREIVKLCKNGIRFM